MLEALKSKDNELAEVKQQLAKAESKSLLSIGANPTHEINLEVDLTDHSEQSELIKVEGELLAAKGLLEEQFSEISKYVDTVEQSTAHNNELQDELDTMRKELERAQATEKTLIDQLSSSKAELAQLTKSVGQSAGANILEMQQELIREQDEHDASKDCCKDQLAELTKLSEERKRVNSAFDQANDALSQNDAEIDKLERSLQEWQDTCSQSQAKIAGLESVLGHKEQQLMQANSKLEMLLQNAQQKLDHTRVAKDAELTELRNELVASRSRSGSMVDAGIEVDRGATAAGRSPVPSDAEVAELLQEEEDHLQSPMSKRMTQLDAHNVRDIATDSSPRRETEGSPQLRVRRGTVR